jgi:hypothetical protein
MDRAQDEDSWPMFVACAREARQSAELVGRLSGELARAEQSGPQFAVQIVIPAGDCRPGLEAEFDVIDVSQ